MTSVEATNAYACFSIPGHLSFAAGPGGLPVARMTNAHGEAEVCLHGAHVMHWQPRGAAPVLWMSRQSRFAEGEPIRGGIPVCWPWFGAHPSDSDKPPHGFVRRRRWEVAGAERTPDGRTALRLALTADPATRALWPHDFRLELAVTVGPELRVELTAVNTGAEPFTATAALHSYFAVSEVSRIRVSGLDGAAYLETAGGLNRPDRQRGDVRIDREVDRVYSDTEAEAVLHDPGLRRRIRVAKSGSRSTVVWNPWIDKARRMPDFGDDEYPEMICVETCNAREDARTLRPGTRHTLAAAITVEND